LTHTIVTDGDVAQPGDLYTDIGRILWVKYYLGGEIGDLMEVKVYINNDYLSEGSFYNYLHDDISKYYINKILMRSFKQNPILLGKVFGTFGSSHITQYEAPSFSGDVRNFSKDLNKHEF